MSPNIKPHGTHGSIGSPRRLRDFKPSDVCIPESCFVQMSAYPKTQKEFLLGPSCGMNWENKSSIARRISAEKWRNRGDNAKVSWERRYHFLGNSTVHFYSSSRTGQSDELGFFFTVFCFTLTNQKPGGYTFLQEANGDVLLDWVALSRLDWLEWGSIFNRVTRMGSDIFGRLANVPECLYCRWKMAQVILGWII